MTARYLGIEIDYEKAVDLVEEMTEGCTLTGHFSSGLVDIYAGSAKEFPDLLVVVNATGPCLALLR